MIEIYLKTNTNYEANGDITLTPTSCIYKDSEYLVTIEHPLDELRRWKYIDYENVISVKNEGKKQLYRIYNVVKSLYSVTAYARPLFFDLIDKVLLDVRPTNKNGKEALNIILEGTGFTGHSNISIINTAYYVRKNIVESILGDDENSFLNRWGGEVNIDNFDIYINDRIGSDNGVRVEFGYNLNDIEEDINIEDVATRIIPTGYNGIMLEGNAPWVDSPLINKYTKPKMRVINFDDVKVKESEEDEGFNTLAEAQAELIKRCNELYEKGIDKPTVNYKVSMIDIANTTAYEDFKMLVSVKKGDTVTCYIKNLDIDVKARVIDYEKDLLTGEYISIELGNAQSNFFNNQADMMNRVDNILNKVIDTDGSLRAQEVKGFLDATKASIKAQKSIAQKQEVRAIECEDTDSSSPTFGSSIFGTMGLMVADSKNLNGDWNYTSALTAKGLVASMLYGKILAGTGVYFDLEKGEVYFNKGKIEGSNSSFNLDTGEIKCSQPDGSEIIISPTQGFYNKFGTSKRGYHHLNFTKKVKFPAVGGSGGGFTETIINLPAEFKGKNVTATAEISNAPGNYVPSSWGVIGSVSSMVDVLPATNQLRVYGQLLCWDTKNNTWHNLNERLEVVVTAIA